MGTPLPRFSPLSHPCKLLSFYNMSNWEKWLCPGGIRGRFPRLQELDIRQCSKLIGELSIHLPSLQELNLEICPQLLVRTLNVPAARRSQLKRQTCGFTALQTSEIEISDVSQWKELPVIPHNLSITKCDSMESLLEEQILQTNMYSLKTCDFSFSRSPSKVGLPTTLQSLSISNCTKVDLILPELFRCHHPVLENLSINGGTYNNSPPLSFSILDISPRLTNFAIHGLRDLRSSAFRFQRAIPYLFLIWKSEGAIILYISNCLLWTQWTTRFPVAPSSDCWSTHTHLCGN